MLIFSFFFVWFTEGDVEIPSNSDPLTIAGLLKLYFRESADFPITKDFRRNLVDTWRFFLFFFLFFFPIFLPFLI